MAKKSSNKGAGRKQTRKAAGNANRRPPAASRGPQKKAPAKAVVKAEPVDTKKTSKFLLLGGVIILIPVAAALVYVQFFGDKENRLDNIHDLGQISRLKQNVGEVIKTQAQDAKVAMDEQVVPMVKEKAQEAATVIKEDVMPAVKEKVGEMIEVATAKIQAWREEKKRLKQEIEGDEATRRKFEAFEKDGIDDLERRMQGSFDAGERAPVEIPSVLSGAMYQSAWHDLEDARSLMNKARFAKPDEASYLYQRASNAYIKSQSFWQKAARNAERSEEKEKVVEIQNEIQGARRTCDAKIKLFLDQESAKRTTRTTAASVPPPPPVSSTASTTGKKPAPVAPSSTSSSVKQPSKTTPPPSTPRPPRPPKTTPVVKPKPPAPATPKGLAGDKRFLKGKAKLGEGIEWYRKSEHARSSGGNRNKYLKQALVRLDAAMDNLDACANSSKYKKNASDVAMLDKMIQETNFLRYACMKHMTL